MDPRDLKSIAEAIEYLPTHLKKSWDAVSVSFIGGKIGHLVDRTLKKTEFEIEF